MEHQQPPIVSEEIVSHSADIRKLLVESFEADYCIKTSEDWAGDQRSNIVENQLRDLGFERNHDYFIIVERKPTVTEQFDIFFAIKLTGAKIDEIADELKLFGDLDVGYCQYQFNKHMADNFICFDAR